MTRGTQKRTVERMQGSGTTVALRWSRDVLVALDTDPTVSSWLRRAITDLAKRDPLDALYDAELLNALMKDRWEVSIGMKEADQPEAGRDGG